MSEERCKVQSGGQTRQSDTSSQKLWNKFSFKYKLKINPQNVLKYVTQFLCERGFLILSLLSRIIKNYSKLMNFNEFTLSFD